MDENEYIPFLVREAVELKDGRAALKAAQIYPSWTNVLLPIVELEKDVELLYWFAIKVKDAPVYRIARAMAELPETSLTGYMLWVESLASLVKGAPVNELIKCALKTGHQQTILNLLSSPEADVETTAITAASLQQWETVFKIAKRHALSETALQKLGRGLGLKEFTDNFTLAQWSFVLKATDRFEDMPHQIKIASAL